MGRSLQQRAQQRALETTSGSLREAVNEESVVDAGMEHSAAVKSNKGDAHNNVNKSYKHIME